MKPEVDPISMREKDWLTKHLLLASLFLPSLNNVSWDASKMQGEIAGEGCRGILREQG
jgi:hypothetical protein